MSLNIEQRKQTLTYLRLSYTQRGDELEVHADTAPTDDDLETAYAELSALPTEPDPDDELRAALEKATTVAQLRDALLGTNSSATVAATRRPTEETPA